MGKKILLKSNDGKTFEVDVAVAQELLTIKHMMELNCANDEIPLPNVTSFMLSKVIEYCKKHVEERDGIKDDSKVSDGELKAWDADFVKVDRFTLLDLIWAADFLNIKSLLGLIWTVDDRIKGKTPEEICKILKLNKIPLKSSDGDTFEVEEVVVQEWQTIKHMIEDDCADNGIPLPNVTSFVLSKVIEHSKKHVEAPDGELMAWDADFVNVDCCTLFDLILAANYLEIKSLLDLTCQTVADMIYGKSRMEMKTLNIKYDFTPEEEEEVRRENPWAFEEL